MSVAEAPLQKQRTEPEDLVLIIDALQHEAGFDSSGPIPDKIAKFEILAQEELSRSKPTNVAIIAGNAALTLVAAIEAANAGAEVIQLVNPRDGKSVSFKSDGTVRGATGTTTLEASLGDSKKTPSGVEVFPLEFAGEDLDKLTRVSMANTDGVDVVTDDPPRLRFVGQPRELTKDSVADIGSRAPFLGAFGASIHLTYLRKKGVIKSGVQVEGGGGPSQLNRVIAASAGKVALGEVAYGGD